ncbi:hypothetical protein L6260_03255 [Candidatus Parcubacteria bacterium]|nr:hypothetical protein [Candidatus Parcubacteria bacterium]
MMKEMDSGREQAEARVWEALKQVRSAKEGALAWTEELKKLQREEKAERNVDLAYYSSAEFRSKKQEAIKNIHGWAEHARRTTDSLGDAPMSSEEQEYANRTLRELDELAGQYEQELEEAA